MMRAPVAVAMRPASGQPVLAHRLPGEHEHGGLARSAERLRAALDRVGVDPGRPGAGGAVAAPSASFHAVSAGRMSVATCPGGGPARPRWRPRRRRPRSGARRRAHPGGHRARDALDVRGERRVVLDVIRRVLAHDVDDGGTGLLRIVEVGEAVAETGAQVQQRRRGILGHAPIPVRRARHHALEQAEHAADAVHLVQRGHEMHLRRAGFVKHTLTPPATSVRARLSAPFIGVSFGP